MFLSFLSWVAFVLLFVLLKTKKYPSLHLFLCFHLRLESIWAPPGLVGGLGARPLLTWWHRTNSYRR